MTLASAHEGYEYQDLLTCYFILNEILGEKSSVFVIDRKQYEEDTVDDLLIKNESQQYKKQIKYSNFSSNQILEKSNLSAPGSYNISIDVLYESWLNHPVKESTEFRVCLAWREPEDELVHILDVIEGHGTFKNYPTKVFRININKIWPKDEKPLSNWKRFSSKSEEIDRDSFIDFCNNLLIEVLMPKISLDLKEPGELEKIVINQAEEIGVGVYPNENISIEHFILKLVSLVKKSRSTGLEIKSSEILHKLNIKTDYGSITQNFPIIKSENLKQTSSIKGFLEKVQSLNKVLLIGDPGCGKSWFIQNLINYLGNNQIKVVKHYCYTDLNDILQSERIKLNVFYGNLIADIVKQFPNLKDVKKQKFASNINELNTLLLSITEPTFLIIDGLDHIERIATYRGFTNISLQDRAIIENLNNLKISPLVKIIVSSQNIQELEKIDSFTKVGIPHWTEKDVKNILFKNHLKDIQFSSDTSLVTFLVQKSSGNPLYLKYLIDEIKKNNLITLRKLENLPNYSYNLKEYYDYLLNKQNLREEVALVLSGLSFSITKNELGEITHLGDFIEESLDLLSPILKTNFSQSGYSIYHESFRRYILDVLREKKLSIEKKIFNPIIEWFDSKDFYSYAKSFRYFIPFLYEGGYDEKVLTKLQYDFVTKSIVYGQSWNSINNNYAYFVKAASKKNSFESIILLNEIDKIITLGQTQFEENYVLYLETIGHIHGYKYLSDFLSFEGEPTVPYSYGLQACYICDTHGEVAPWDLYIKHFENCETIVVEEFKYLIRYLLISENDEKLNKIAKDLLSRTDISEYFDVLHNEVKIYKNHNYIELLIQKWPSISLVYNYVKNEKISLDEQSLILLAEEILTIEDIHSQEKLSTVKAFFNAFLDHLDNTFLIERIISKFQKRNWFFNWIIYYIKINVLIKKANELDFKEVKGAFLLLNLDTDPFKGKPRTCDLYEFESYIYNSLKEGLSLVRTESEWTNIIKILVQVSNETTTTLQRSLGGPLASNKLFELLLEFISDNNKKQIIIELEKIKEDKSEFHLHSNIGEYYLQLAKAFSLNRELESAKKYLNKGVEFSLAYTMRKDLTLVDLIDSIEHYVVFNKNQALESLKKLKVLVDSAVSHTDGKETNHFPKMWFEKMILIDSSISALYLLEELLVYPSHWINEDCLKALLYNTNGEINPEIEYFIALTFPLEISKEYIEYNIELFNKVSDSIYRLKIENNISDKLMHLAERDLQSEKIRNFSLENGIELSISDSIITHEGEELSFSLPKKDKEKFSLTTIEEFLLYIELNEIEEENIEDLKNIIKTVVILSDDVKELIRLVTLKNYNLVYRQSLNLDIVFNSNKEVECYYLVCKYMYTNGGWYERFVDIDSFIKAYSLDEEKALNYFFELIPPLLIEGNNRSFSSSLIKLLVKLDYNVETINKSWNNLLEITDYRLPIQKDIDWENIIESDMSSEEVFICILLSRFKVVTTERFRIVIAGIERLMSVDCKKLIKPFLWFIQHKDSFSDLAFTIILQFIYSSKNKAYQLSFKDELLAVFPTYYFLQDYLISRLYDLDLPLIEKKQGQKITSIHKGAYSFLYYLNSKYYIFNLNGIDLNDCFTKYIDTFQNVYNDKLELYYNRSKKKMTQHIFSTEYMFKLFHTEKYREFYEWSLFDSPEYFEKGIFIDIASITAPLVSRINRPKDLIEPNVINSKDFLQIDNSKWIRLGHHEILNVDNREVIVNGGIVFADEVKESFPYYDIALFPFLLWDNRVNDLEVRPEVTLFIHQKDALENYSIIWLNPAILKSLNLTLKKDYSGLYAINEKNEKILIMRTWIDYKFKESYYISISDESPIRQGTDLIIRSDYFNQISQLFNCDPKYFLFKKEE